jgi:glycosyltransferase involved in cell wall biosynthesis
VRILQVCPRYPPQVGGVEHHVQQISERLASRGHEVTVHTADAGGDGQTRDNRNGVRIRRHAGGLLSLAVSKAG